MTTPNHKYTSFPILMADDDPDDQLLTRDAFQEITPVECISFVDDGEALLSTLRTMERLPRLILLDWNMPRKNGYETLTALKSDSKFTLLPVVVLTTSTDPSDIELAIKTGAASFMTKPLAYEGLVAFAKEMLTRYAPEVLV
jgi:CheY-like chemotaxis protein